MGAVLHVTATLEDVGECPQCGTRFAIPSNLLHSLRENKSTFYCPNGHPQSFRKSKTEELEAQLKAEREKRERADELLKGARKVAEDAQLSARFARGKLRAMKERVRNGVCPCCKRSFVQLARHMRTKHPDFVPEEPHEPPPPAKP